MRLLLLLSALLCQLVLGRLIEAEYAVKFGIFGEIGISRASLHTEGERYSIIIEADSGGVAKFLSNHRKERYESHGMIQNGIYVPERFIKQVSSNAKGDFSEFIFDHEAKSVVRKRLRFKLDDEGKRTDERTEDKTFDYYARDDLLSLFFNLPFWIKGLEAGERLVMYAVGANRKDGRVDLYLPAGKDLAEIQKTMEMKEGNFVVVAINQNIFASKNGELLLNLGEDYLVRKAVLKDVIFFGHVTGTLMKRREE